MRVSGVIFENLSSFTGRFPKINVSEQVVNELGADPMFVTLPVGFSNSESRNGRKYDEKSARAILEAINTQKPIGQKGHLRAEDRPYKFETPPFIWVGAVIEHGTVWGKAFIMEHAADVREYVRVAKATGAMVGTSIYGTADIDADGNVSNLQIESIDLAHPARLGLPQAARTPVITSESHAESAALAQRLSAAVQAMTSDSVSRSDIIQRIADATDMGPDAIEAILADNSTDYDEQTIRAMARVLNISEDDTVALMAPPDADGALVEKTKPEDYREAEEGNPMPEDNTTATAETAPGNTDAQVAELQNQLREARRDYERHIAELKQQLADFRSMGQIMQVSETDDPVVMLRSLMAERDGLMRENADLLTAEIENRVKDKVKVENLRPIIEQMVLDRKPVRKADVQTALDQVMLQESVKRLLQATVIETSGPPQTRPAQQTTETVSHSSPNAQPAFVIPGVK